MSEAAPAIVALTVAITVWLYAVSVSRGPRRIAFRAEDTPPELMEALAEADYSRLPEVALSPDRNPEGGDAKQGSVEDEGRFPAPNQSGDAQC